MTKRTLFIVLSVTVLMLTGMAYVVISQLGDVNLVNDNAQQTTNVFYNMQLGNTDMVYSIAMLSIITIVGGILPIYIKNGPSRYPVMMRLGYARFLRRGSLLAFLGGFLLSALLMVYQMFLISMFIHPLDLDGVSTVNQGGKLFDDGSLISAIEYIVIAAIGWGIYSIFIFSVSLWVKKTAITIILGAVLATVSIALPAFLITILPQFIEQALYVLAASTLLSPGTMTLNFIQQTDIIFYFLWSAFIYLGISVTLMQGWIKKNKVSF